MGKELRSPGEDPAGLDEERLGGRAKSVTVGFALLLLLGAGAFMFFVDDKPDPSKNRLQEFTFESKGVQEARPDEPEGLAQLQRLVLSPDPSVASQAVLKLAMSGESGWLAMLSVLPNASPEVKATVQGAMFPPGRLASAAVAITSGPLAARKGAYIALDMADSGAPALSEDPSEYASSTIELYRALLTRAMTEDEQEAETVFKLLMRFHPSTPNDIRLMLNHESPIVRAVGVNSSKFQRDPETKALVKALESDPDPRVRAAIQGELKTSSGPSPPYMPETAPRTRTPN